MLSNFALTELMHRALASPVGIEVETSDVHRLRQRCYLARTEAANPAFEALTFSPSRTQPATHLWIVKNGR